MSKQEDAAFNAVYRHPKLGSARARLSEAELTLVVEIIEKALSASFRKVFEPFAMISLVRDTDPSGHDAIEGPDLAITPSQVRAARKALGLSPEKKEG